MSSFLFGGSEKNGKERTYFPTVDRESYLKFETGNFLKQFHKNSYLSLVSTMCDDGELSDEEIVKLMEILKKRRG